MTVIWSTPTALILAAGINDTIPLGPMKMLAGRELPFHSAAEQGRKPLPFTVNDTGGPDCVSNAALSGEIEVMAGAGRAVPVGIAVNENGSEFDVIVELETVIATEPWNAVSAGVITAVSCVGLT